MAHQGCPRDDCGEWNGASQIAGKMDENSYQVNEMVEIVNILIDFSMSFQSVEAYK
jgi:hypothetical protein